MNNFDIKDAILKIIEAQRDTVELVSATLNPVMKNNNVSLDVSELRLTLSNDDTISIYFNTLTVTETFGKLEDTHKYYLRKRDGNLYLERKADGWRYYLIKLGDDKHQELLNYLTPSEWYGLKCLPTDPYIELFENDILDKDKCFETCMNGLKEIKLLIHSK